MPEVLVPISEKISTNIRRLSLDAAQVMAASPDSNAVISGTGVWTAFMVLLAGAKGSTADQLAGFLGFRPEEAAATVDELERHLATVGGLAHSTALWARIPVWREFQDNFPNVTFAGLDDQRSLDEWASAATGGLIPRFPVHITSETLAVLANAISARARWIKEFSAGQTEDGPFVTRNGSSVSTPFMQQTLRSSHFTERDDLIEFRMDLISQSQRHAPRLQMRFYLGPTDLAAVEVLERALTAAPGNKVDADKVRLSLPKFSVRQSHDLKRVVEKLGVIAPFTNASDLSLISPEPLKISQAVQESVLNINEEGVEAASITALSAMEGAAPRPEPKIIDVRFDHPFAFALFEPKVEIPLFIGWVADPTLR